MKKTISLIMLLQLFNVVNVLAQLNQHFNQITSYKNFTEYELKSNGLRVILMPDASFPVAHVQVVYKVGSKDEVRGQTGATHLLEHLLFKQTKKFNKNTATITDTLQRYGSTINASTWNDRTNYFQTVPSDKVELALSVEADRMRNAILTQADKESEMTVVRNEYEQLMNNPLALLDMEVWATAFMAHPYHHPTIGWKSDIENISIESLQHFYHTYYWPNNAVLTVVGNFDSAQVLQWVHTYFGGYTASPHKIPTISTQEPIQFGLRTVTVKRPGQTYTFSKNYKIPGVLHPDYPALKALGLYLGGSQTSVLSRQLVDTGLALEVQAGPSAFQLTNLFSIGITTPNNQHQQLDTKLKAIINQIKKQGVAESVLKPLLQMEILQDKFSMDGAENIGEILCNAVASGNWIAYLQFSEALGKVTAADVKRVANLYLDDTQATIAYFSPTAAGTSQPTNLAPSKCYYHAPGVQVLPAANAVPSIPFEQFKIGTIQVTTVKTATEGMVAVNGSLPGGLLHSPNQLIPELLPQLLLAGTKKHSKYAFQEKLAAKGIDLIINTDLNHLNFNFKCLTADLPEALQLVAEALQQPAFLPHEFALAKQQLANELKESQYNEQSLARRALAKAIYPQKHPYYKPTIEEELASLKQLQLADVVKFYKQTYGKNHLQFSMVGDVPQPILKEAISTHFGHWQGGVAPVKLTAENLEQKAANIAVKLPEGATSGVLLVGTPLPVTINHPDYWPLQVAVNALGGGFAGRLMKTVRDEEGLTYTIEGQYSADDQLGGLFMIYATFNPQLFSKGTSSTLREWNKWAENGISATEFEHIRSNVIGSMQVQLANHSALSHFIMELAKEGKTPAQFTTDLTSLASLNLRQINDVIKRYFDKNKLVVVEAK